MADITRLGFVLVGGEDFVRGDPTHMDWWGARLRLFKLDQRAGTFIFHFSETSPA